MVLIFVGTDSAEYRNGGIEEERAIKSWRDEGAFSEAVGLGDHRSIFSQLIDTLIADGGISD